MKPVVDPFLACSALGLGDLVRVMDRDVIDASRVNVELFAQVLHAHGRALDVPARIASSPGALPDHGLVLELGFREPEREVGRITLIAIYLDARARLQLVELEEGKLAVARELAHVEIEIAAGQVGEAPFLDRYG